LVPNPGFNQSVQKTIASTSRSVLDKVTPLHDARRMLNPNFTWLLEQLGVVVPNNSTPTEALSLMYKASNQIEKANLFHLVAAGLDKGQVSDSSRDVPEVCTVLGIASAS
jgi:hypothetical protein